MSVTDYEDPFAGADADNDEFETAKTEYLGLGDLTDHLVVIDVLSIGTKQGDGEYEYAECNVVVVDGPTLELLPRVPAVVERMHISASGVVPQIKHLAGSGKPFLCRPDFVINKRKQKVVGVRKNEVTDADKAKALPVWRKYRAGQFA